MDRGPSTMEFGYSWSSGGDICGTTTGGDVALAWGRGRQGDLADCQLTILVVTVVAVKVQARVRMAPRRNGKRMIRRVVASPRGALASFVKMKYFGRHVGGRILTVSGSTESVRCE